MYLEVLAVIVCMSVGLSVKAQNRLGPQVDTKPHVAVNGFGLRCFSLLECQELFANSFLKIVPPPALNAVSF